MKHIYFLKMLRIKNIDYKNKGVKIMTTIEKQNIYIDKYQQDKERNIDLGDYPVYHQKTGRQLKHSFNHYFKDLDAYYISKNSNYVNWSDKHKRDSYEAFLFFEVVNYNEFRY